ncbi:MAG: AtpZ/AtpI family protein [Lachnospira sp.]|nr:AtpZ/AtpI family protein [Lachnospira sp.]
MSGKGSAYRNIVLISQVSINMMVPIFVCVAAGFWLDKKFGTSFTLPLMILGIAAGARNAYMLVMSTIKQEEYHRKKEQEEQIREVLERANVDKNDEQNKGTE